MAKFTKYLVNSRIFPYFRSYSITVINVASYYHFVFPVCHFDNELLLVGLF
jgi:hypothetical protein